MGIGCRGMARRRAIVLALGMGLCTYAGAEDGKMAIGDQWPINSALGLGWDPVLGHSTSLALFVETPREAMRQEVRRRG